MKFSKQRALTECTPIVKIFDREQKSKLKQPVGTPAVAAAM